MASDDAGRMQSVLLRMERTTCSSIQDKTTLEESLTPVFPGKQEFFALFLHYFKDTTLPAYFTSGIASFYLSYSSIHFTSLL